MRKVSIKMYLVVLLVAFVGIGGLVAASAQATGPFVVGSDAQSKLSAGDTVDASAYMTGERIDVNGTLNGDLYCAGQNIIITGTVNGDVICAGQQITISGAVNGDVRAAASKVQVDGKISGAATIASGELSISEQGSIDRDLTAASSAVTISGTIGRDVVMGAERFNLGGSIGRTMLGSLTTLDFGSSAKIGGDLHYSGTKELSIPEDKVAGDVTFTRTEASKQTSASEVFMGILLWLLMLVVLTVAMTLVAPKFVHESASGSYRGVLLQFLAGFAFLALAPLAAFILLLTGGGTLVSLLIMVLWMLMLLVSMVLFSYFVGFQLLRQRATNALLVALVGALVVAVLWLVPFINVITMIATFTIGTGMALFKLRDQFGPRPYSIISEPATSTPAMKIVQPSQKKPARKA